MIEIKYKMRTMSSHRATGNYNSYDLSAESYEYQLTETLPKKNLKDLGKSRTARLGSNDLRLSQTSTIDSVIIDDVLKLKTGSFLWFSKWK